MIIFIVMEKDKLEGIYGKGFLQTEGILKKKEVFHSKTGKNHFVL